MSGRNKWISFEGINVSKNNQERADIVRSTQYDIGKEHDKEYPFGLFEDDGDVDGDKKVLEVKETLEQIASEKFADAIKLDFIKSVDYRIMCRFLGLRSVTEVKSYPYKGIPIIVNLLEQVIPEYMKSEGYAFVGELNFDRNGDSVPVEKKVWKIGNKELIFAITGFLYYEKIDGTEQDNIVFFNYYDQEREIHQLSCFSPDDIKCETVVNNLEKFAKTHNCLRGCKLRDLDLHNSTFSIINSEPSKYTWDKYYYPEGVKELFDNEIFGFLNDIKSYNQCGINKRGVIVHGKPGGGKTSLGYIICNNVKNNTVIWITPELITKFINSIKEFYQLADFVSPCIVILEDLDLFGVDRDLGGDIHRLGTLMNILDGVNSINNSITVATTNRLDTIEKALRNRPGRFDRIVEIPSLDDKLRRKMIQNRLSDWDISENNLDYIISKTDEWTGAQVQEFINTVNLTFIRKKDMQKVITQELADSVFDTMYNYGVGEQSKAFGFAAPSKKSENETIGFGRKSENK